MSVDDSTGDRLRSVLRYEQDSGLFYWLQSPSNKAKIGHRAGYVDACGYRRIGFQNVEYHEHRLAWLFVHGEWPKNVIDHINGNTTDNRITNLRDVSHQKNINNRTRINKNNTSGKTGTYRISNGKWVAHIKHNFKKIHIGCYATQDEAHAAYLAKKAELAP